MSKYKIRYKEVGRSRIGETTYSGPLSEDEVIAKRAETRKRNLAKRTQL